MSSTNAPFWEAKRLDDLSTEEWEALCDGCGLCCLLKLEDIDSGDVYYTNVACRLLDLGRCRCRAYARRRSFVPDCVKLERSRLEHLRWMPATCAYRLRYEGKPLPSWHPLVSGDPESVHRAGVSVRGRAVAEGSVPAESLEEHLIDWASATVDD